MGQGLETLDGALIVAGNAKLKDVWLRNIELLQALEASEPPKGNTIP